LANAWEYDAWLTYGRSTLVAGPAPVPAQSQGLEEIIVTGSRIGRDAADYVGPMSVIDSADIERTPNYSVQDMLLKLPSIGLQGISRNNASGGRGAHLSGIHQLTPERTLVLLNGRRMVHTISSSLAIGVDLQSFPVNLIDSIEVLADGASAIYGSDAVAGVINVRTRRFEGVELSAGFGTPEDPGGDSYNPGFIAGRTGERGHITLAATIVDTGNVDAQQRDWSQIPILGQLDSGDGAILTLMGSGIPPEGRQPDAGIIFKPDPVSGASFQPYDTFGTSGLNGSAGDGSLQSILDTGHRFNYSNIEGGGPSLVSGSRVVNGAITGELELDRAVLFYELLGMHREGTLRYTPMPIADALGRFTDLLQVPFSNPHVPADAVPVIRAATGPDADRFQMWWRAADLRPRLYNYDSDTMKITAGLRGKLPWLANAWEYDAWLTYGRSTLDEVTRNQVNVARLQTALDPVACAQDPACPKDARGNPTLDIFGRGTKSREEIDYVLFTDEEATRYEFWHLAGSLTGELWSLPGGPIGVAAGLEWRHEEGNVHVSELVQLGHSADRYAEPTQGDFSVWEAFAEFHAPLLAGRSFAHELSLDAAVRYSEYNHVGSEATFKLALHWAPVHDVHLRGVFATGFRAPNILESFGGIVDTYPTVADPCNSAADLYRNNATVRANCTRQGIPAGYVQNASQLKISAGGNPALEPETSDSFSVGLAWTPDAIENLSLTVDYYDVRVDKAINTPDPVDVILTCYTTPNLAAPECARVGRGPSGTIIRFDLLNENLARLETSGIDLNASWSLSTDFGDISFNGNVNWLNEYVETTGSGAVSNRTDMVAGNIADWAGYPEWRANLSLSLSRNNWTLGGSWRYLDAMDIFDTIQFDNIHTTVDAINYFDLFGNYRGNTFNITLGAENITNETPPYVPDVSDNTSSIYDYLGRFYYVRLKLGF
ncbi:MAG: TonB-dependent receptor, partial [Gammaproteobacteria bacterium]|nr:TonB-dependent receptor [Gammaproteobacteria bacterium]